MARKIVVVPTDGSFPLLLTEVAAHDEAQLQETMRGNPDLLPIDEFGMVGPLMVVGRETVLPSGAVDLVALARSGELLIVEFKTGPSNPDFRAVLAQLLDYGSDLWGMSLEQFEQAVAARYFASSYCSSTAFKGESTLGGAMKTAWSDMTDDEAVALRESLSHQLETGSFHYVAVAQRFTPTVLKTVDYLNASMAGARLYAVEMVRFAAAGASAFEARTLLGPKPANTTTKGRIEEKEFLESIADEGYADALRDFLEFCHGFGLTVFLGTVGMSIRLSGGQGSSPLSIGWLFPPGKAGWYGLSDANFGVDGGSLTAHQEWVSALDGYLTELSRIPDTTAVNKGSPKAPFRAWNFQPGVFVQRVGALKEAITHLVLTVNGGNAA